MHDDYTDDYITFLIARLHEQLDDEYAIDILQKALDYTKEEATNAIKNADRPAIIVFDDDIGSLLIDKEDKQEIYNILDADFMIYKIIMNHNSNNNSN